MTAMFTELVQTGVLEPHHAAFGERWGAFAEDAVAPTIAERSEARRISRPLWRRMAEAGMAGVLVPEAHGGAGQDARCLMVGLDAFVAAGHDLGLAVSLNVHNLIVNYLFVPHATAEQRERYLPGLVGGDTLVALAVSEPETGAHPKHLKTRAVRDGDVYRITGQKAYITNGPEADLLILVAVTDDTGPRKAISAFLVERETPGLDISAPMDLGFLRTSPHAEVRLQDCPVPAAQMIGPDGGAYDALVRNFRTDEDTFGCGLMTGLLAWQLAETVSGEPGTAAAAGGAPAEPIGTAQSALSAARVIAAQVAALRDHGAGAGDGADALLDACSRVTRMGFEAVAEAWEPFAPADDDPISLARRELGLAGVGGRVRAIRRARRGARLAQTAGGVV